MRKTAIGLAILLFLALAGLFVAPYFLDLNRLKGPLAAELAGLTGRAVELRGPITLSLLAGPTVTLRDLHIANPPGTAAEDMVRLRAVEGKLAFWPLLAGRVELRSVALVAPELDLERLANGAGNWQTGAADRTPGVLAVDRLSIEDGTVTYRSGATVERFEHIDAQLAFGGPTGAFSAKGGLATRGVALGFEFDSGRLDATEVPVQATLSLKPATRLELDAVLRGAADDRRIDGKLKLVSDNFRTLAAIVARTPLPASFAQPLTASADLAGSPGDIALDHLVLDLGSAHGEGRLRIAPGLPLGLGLQLSLGELDLDRWLAARKAALAPTLGSAFAATPDASAPLPLPASPPEMGPSLPQGIDMKLDISVAALLWRKALIRDARLKGSLVKGEATLDQLSALLPGGSQISLSGKGKLGGEGWRGLGLFSAKSDDLRGMLAWLGVAASAVPADRLRKAAVAGHFALTGDRLDLNGIDAALDATKVTGAATVILRARPGFGLRLAADNFNLDAYLPRDALPLAGDNDRLGAALDALDLNLDLHVDALTWRGQPLGDVEIAGSLVNGEAAIRELRIGDIAGAALQLSGGIDAPGGASPKLHLAIDAKGPELDAVLRLVVPQIATGFSYRDFHLAGTLSSDADKLALDATLEVLSGSAHVSGSVVGASGAATLAVELSHPSFAALVQKFVPGYRPAGGDPGVVKLSSRMGIASGHIALDDLALAIGGSTLGGKVDIDLTGARPKLAADLKLGDWAIDRLLAARQTAALDDRRRPGALLTNIALAQGGTPARPGERWSSAPLDLAALSLADIDLRLSGHSLAYGRWRIDQPVVAAALKDGALAVTRLGGTFFGGGIEASGELASAPKPALSAWLALKNADLKAALAAAGVDVIDGRFDIDARLGSEGESAAEIVDHLSGDAKFAGRDGSIAGLDLKAVSDRLASPDRPADLLGLLRSGAGGRTPFSTLEGSFEISDGIALADNIRLAATGGEARASASFDLPRWTLASRIEFRLAGAPQAPPLTLRLDGAIDEPHAVFEVNALQQYLAQRSPPAGQSQPTAAPSSGGR